MATENHTSQPHVGLLLSSGVLKMTGPCHDYYNSLTSTIMPSCDRTPLVVSCELVSRKERKSIERSFAIFSSCYRGFVHHPASRPLAPAGSSPKDKDGRLLRGRRPRNGSPRPLPRLETISSSEPVDWFTTNTSMEGAADFRQLFSLHSQRSTHKQSPIPRHSSLSSLCFRWACWLFRLLTLFCRFIQTLNPY